MSVSLHTRLGALELQNPIILAAGTAAYGREVANVTRLEALGGLVTKAVSLEPRAGAVAPRVAEFAGGMINAIGLANPGLDVVRTEALPWLAQNLSRCKVIVNVIGHRVEDFARVVEQLSGERGQHGFELNVSCPNVEAGGLEFGADARALHALVTQVRAISSALLLVKLSPTLPDIVAAARTALDAGADAITLTNTLPGLVVDVEHRRPALGFGTGGVSGAALLPVGVLATWKVSRATGAPVVGLGGVSTGEEALQYIMAGASAVGVGTAALRDPRAPERIVNELEEWMGRHGVRTVDEVRGSLQWPK